MTIRRVYHSVTARIWLSFVNDVRTSLQKNSREISLMLQSYRIIAAESTTTYPNSPSTRTTRTEPLRHGDPGCDVDNRGIPFEK